MNNEEFEKRREFFLDQQAQFASELQQLREVQAHRQRML